MKIFATIALVLCVGCNTVNAPTPPLAPGYSSQADQIAGQTLASLHDFVATAVADYDKLTPTQQATEKPLLNNLVNVVNGADSIYTAYHAGTQTLANAQSAIQSAQAAQANFLAAGGVK